MKLECLFFNRKCGIIGYQITVTKMKLIKLKPGMVGHAFNSSTQEF